MLKPPTFALLVVSLALPGCFEPGAGSSPGPVPDLAIEPGKVDGVGSLPAILMPEAAARFLTAQLGFDLLAGTAKSDLVLHSFIDCKNSLTFSREVSVLYTTDGGAHAGAATMRSGLGFQYPYVSSNVPIEIGAQTPEADVVAVVTEMATEWLDVDAGDVVVGKQVSLTAPAGVTSLLVFWSVPSLNKAGLAEYRADENGPRAWIKQHGMTQQAAQNSAACDAMCSVRGEDSCLGLVHCAIECRPSRHLWTEDFEAAYATCLAENYLCYQTGAQCATGWANQP